MFYTKAIPMQAWTGN